MPILTIFKSSIPTGMRVFEYGIDVVEVNNRHRAARKFVRRSKRRVYLQRISDHKDDPRAIRVIGKSKGWFFHMSECIGYVPAEIASKLMDADMQDKVIARLQSISIHDKRSIGIRLDILGTEDDYTKYCSDFS